MSVQTDLDARVASLKGILDESNAALTDKGGEAAQNLSGLPEAIENLPTAELSDVYIVPTGKDFEVEPDEGTGFGTISVAGDYNLEPQNIAAGVTIYGVEGTLVPGATSSIPEEYQPYVDHALLLYTGEYENMAILEWNEHLAIMFLMSDFAVTEYNETTTEFKAQGWVSCSFNKLTDNWTFTDWRDTPSTGGNYVMNIRYSSVYWYYNGQIIWPFGMSGGGGGGGGAGLNIAYGDTAPEDTTKLWVKAAEPSAVKVTTNLTLEANGLEQVGQMAVGLTEISSAAVGNKIYLFGGRESNYYMNTIQVFDATTKNTEQLSVTMPKALSNLSSEAVGSKIYLFGGGDNSSWYNTIHVFDTESNTFETLSATLPVACACQGSAVVGSKIYLFGGMGSGRYDHIIEFDTTTNTVTTLSVTLPAKYGYITAVAAGTKIYLFGGTNSGASNTIHVFDSDKKTISTLSTTLPTATYLMPGTLIGSKIYLFGGVGLNTINAFDIEEHTIKTLETTMPYNPCPGCVAEVVGNTAYVIGGNSIYRNKIFAFSCSASLETGSMVLLYSTGGTNIPIISSDALTVEMNVVSAYIGDESGAAQPAEAFIFKDGAWTAI